MRFSSAQFRTTFELQPIRILKQKWLSRRHRSVRPHAQGSDVEQIHAILLTILCGWFNVNESLGCSLEMCAADVIQPSQRGWEQGAPFWNKS